MEDLGHCLGPACKPTEDGYCSCYCGACDVAYFRRNLYAAIARGRDHKEDVTVVAPKFTPEQLEALSKDEDFVL